MCNTCNEGPLFLSCMAETSPGTGPNITPQQETHESRHTLMSDPSHLCYEYTVCICLSSSGYVCSSVFRFLQQDMGQDIEPYFQAVLATLEQCVEEGSKGEGGALRSDLHQLYLKIVTDTVSGGNSVKKKYKYRCKVEFR